MKFPESGVMLSTIIKANLNNCIFEEVNNFNQTSKPEIDENVLLYFDL